MYLSGNVTFSSDERVFFVQILIILTLTRLILMKMILQLLLMSDLQPGAIDLNNVMHLKKDINKELIPLG